VSAGDLCKSESFSKGLQRSTPLIRTGWTWKAKRIELTSEDAAYPIDGALIPGRAQSGEQTIRLLFTRPQRVSRIQLLFREDQQQRIQVFLLRWSSDGGQSYREIVRQQFNFSPPGTTHELEDHAVDLEGMTAPLKVSAE